MNNLRENTEFIKSEAARLGFSGCGIARPEFTVDDAEHYLKWIEKGYNAGLDYMERNISKRLNPALLVEGTLSVVTVILNYYPSARQQSDAPVISKYAYGNDYHLVIKEKLKLLLEAARTKIPGADGRAFCDSAPVLEHAWARRSGLGWIGKNSLLITKKHGSFVFIGELLLNCPLEYDTPVTDHCGNCRKCIDACPTGAIVSDRVINAERCISYNTIESHDAPQVELSNHIFGCDICQDVCPWNRKLVPHDTPGLEPVPELMKMTGEEWSSLGRDDFNKLFRNSALKRAGYEKIKSNLEHVLTEKSNIQNKVS